MKQFFALALSAVCLLTAAIPAQAALRAQADLIEPSPIHDDYDQAFVAQIGVLDWFFTLDPEFMHYTVSAALYPWEEGEMNGWLPVTVDAQDFEAVLYRHFAPSEQQLAALRAACNYSAAEQTYQIQAYGGFGGGLAPRRYMGYVANGDGTYEVFWQNITYLYLDTTDAALMSALEAAGWPSTWEYQGTVYRAGPDGYTAIGSYDAYGRRYTVSLVEDTVRFLACTDFTAADLPEAFDHVKQVKVEAPEEIAVVGAADAFPDRTSISVEAVTDQGMVSLVLRTFPDVLGTWMIWSLRAPSFLTADLQIQITLPTLLTGEELFACVTDADGALQPLEAAVEPMENGVLATLVLEAGSLPTFAVCVQVPPQTDPPITELPETTDPETAPPDTGDPETLPPDLPDPPLPPVTDDPQIRPDTENRESAPVTDPQQTNPPPSSPTSTNPSATTPSETTEEEKKGCGNAIAISGMLPLLLGALLWKKKND